MSSDWILDGIKELLGFFFNVIRILRSCFLISFLEIQIAVFTDEMLRRLECALTTGDEEGRWMGLDETRQAME